MTNRTLLLIIGLWLGVLCQAGAEPKAYELVKYQGKAAGIAIAFDFADGYPEASEIRITHATSGKTTKFLMADSDEAMHFAPAKAGGAIKSVTLKMDSMASAPPKVEGSYLAGGKSVSFMLTRSKQGK